MKKDLIQRIEAAEIRAVQTVPQYIRQLLEKMTTEELKEIADGEIAEERLRELLERAKKR